MKASVRNRPEGVVKPIRKGLMSFEVAIQPTRT
jgi:molybdopterin-binding protein